MSNSSIELLKNLLLTVIKKATSIKFEFTVITISKLIIKHNEVHSIHRNHNKIISSHISWYQFP